MSNQLIIDAAHPEEVRVAVLRDGEIKEFDFEAQARRSSIGHIYLGKVTRVEPSLQACFVDYGGGRHGFLPLSDIHPDYYQIPKADRDALLAAGSEPHDDAAPSDEAARTDVPSADGSSTDGSSADGSYGDGGYGDGGYGGGASYESAQPAPALQPFPHADGEDTELREEEPNGAQSDGSSRADTNSQDALGSNHPPAEIDDAEPYPDSAEQAHAPDRASDEHRSEQRDEQRGEQESDHQNDEDAPRRSDSRIEQVGGEETTDSATLAARRKWLRRYKIQEVIKRNQIILVQIAKEERPNKGAALTSYLSLVGRYCVLMPNTARGGTLSRKIFQQRQRQAIKNLLTELALPSSMGLIIRTSGGGQPLEEIRKDYDHLQSVWNQIRERTLQSRAPSLIHEDGNLIERALRDYCRPEIDEVVIEGDEGYEVATRYMESLMPDALDRLKRASGPQRIFEALGVEEHLAHLLQPDVPLKSGGHLVINQTEALVAVDVNSGKATREHSIEKTALATNLEAAEEIARQMRLRDLAGLIVIDFIDMAEGRNNRAVEKRLKSCLRGDRARIQLGRISGFGLMEMSRQRMRSGIYAGSSVPCPHCLGRGRMRSVENRALLVLRRLMAQAEAHRGQSAPLTLYVAHDVAHYIAAEKQDALSAGEREHEVTLQVRAAPAYHALEHAITAEETDVPPPPESMETNMPAASSDGRRPSRRRRGGRRHAARNARYANDNRDAPADEADSAAADSAEADSPGATSADAWDGAPTVPFEPAETPPETTDAESAEPAESAARAKDADAAAV